MRDAPGWKAPIAEPESNDDGYWPEELAMIEEVGVGARDVGRPVLWFTVSGDGWGALQVLDLDDERAVTMLSAVREAHDLNGRVCVVKRSERDALGTVKYVRLLKPARRSG